MPKRYYTLTLLVLVVLASGLFFPKLMDTDAPEYAGVAMRMYQTGHWSEIVNRSYGTGQPFDYLEKPHMLYWSALPGYVLFGVHDYAYRLLSVLLTLVAAFAVSRVGTMLYHKRAGLIAAFMFVSAQAIILANHDVRTDSLLTSFCILAVWQLLAYVTRKKSRYLLLAGLFLACAIATKGMIAALVCGGVMFFYLAGKRDWSTLFSWKWLWLLVSCLVFLSPVLYFYYTQFDLHPEKLVNGRHGVSGVRYLLWSQSFDRFSGTGDFTGESPEFIFFFHTLLWALLPWSILCYGNLVQRLAALCKTRGRSFFDKEQLSFTGVWVLFVLMSLSKVKLPHYINVLFPLLCVGIAGYLYRLHEEGKSRVLKRYTLVQWVLTGLLIVAGLVLNVWAFPVQQYWIMISLALLTLAAVTHYRMARPDALDKVWMPSAITVLLLNFLLNTHFYPRIDQYQGGSAMAERIRQKGYEPSDIYLYGYVCRSFDFYMAKWSPVLDNPAILQKEHEGKEVLLFVDQQNLDRLSTTFRYTVLETLPDFHITALDLSFLNPATRAASCGKVYLVKVLP
ncbi:ArnT family glycosyltransferase [Taibaiella koreensis]|uniref:ArnT family glycosyltransferase n=1 Tax=Taibaiella koreensis TaxID=1268548 RepID=UPI000E59C85D|nr:glycosyltransferase family 39 protein [Taibaiella koreensis]